MYALRKKAPAFVEPGSESGRLQAGRMIDKEPRDFETTGQVRSERFNAKGFGRVMTTVENIDPKFLGQSIRPMRSLARDERINTLGSSHPQFASRATGHHSNSPADFGAAGNDQGLAAGSLLQQTRQLGPSNRGLALETKILASLKKERLETLYAQRSGELDIVA